MSDREKILAVLQELDIEVAGSLVQDVEETVRYFIFVPVARNAENHQVPSNRRLHRARERLGSEGYAVEFLLRDGNAGDVETGLRASLLHSFIDDLRNVFLSISEGQAYIWIEQKRALDAQKLKNIAERAKTYLSTFDLTPAPIRSMAGENLPSKLACMKAVRLLAPAKLETIATYLDGQGMTVPSQAWLSKRLDTIRRNGMIVWLESDQGFYPDFADS
jgi:hypothetical protein